MHFLKNFHNALVFCLFLTANSWSNPDTNTPALTAFESGNAAYEAENFEQAIEHYTRAIEESPASPEIYYNLGNSFFQLKQFGQAILNFERAALKKPNDPEILENLALARSRVSTLPEPTSIFVRMAKAGTWNTWIWLTTLSVFFAALIAITGAFWKFPSRWKFSAPVLLVFSFLFATLAYVNWQIPASPHAWIVTEAKLHAHEAPVLNSKAILPLPPGQMVRVLKKNDHWALIQVADKRKGWVQLHTIAPIQPI